MTAPRCASGTLVARTTAIVWLLAATTCSNAATMSVTLHAPSVQEQRAYAFLAPNAQVVSLRDAFPAPPGFERIPLEPGSFGAWLRNLPLRGPSPVHDHRGQVVLEQGDSTLAAVAALDVGPRDLQQCADSILRLHAEWLWSSGRASEIAYRFTSGHLARWPAWASGDRPVVEGSSVHWRHGASADGSRSSFRAFLDTVFTYAATMSIAKDATPVEAGGLRPGDFLLQAGSPGHAVLLLDMAENTAGEKVALIGQGFMPAQDFHVLASGGGMAWFPLVGDGVRTPRWPRRFEWSQAHRLRG